MLFSVLLFVLVKAIVRRSAKYFMSQQIAMGDVNAYVEEMIEGQKVVKVFNYENKAIQAFGERTKELFNNASQALKYGMITMPVVVSMGFLLYVLIGILGGCYPLKFRLSYSCRLCNNLLIGMCKGRKINKIQRKFLRC